MSLGNGKEDYCMYDLKIRNVQKGGLWLLWIKKYYLVSQSYFEFQRYEKERISYNSNCYTYLAISGKVCFPLCINWAFFYLFKWIRLFPLFCSQQAGLNLKHKDKTCWLHLCMRSVRKNITMWVNILNIPLGFCTVLQN